jgi:meckelin
LNLKEFPFSVKKKTLPESIFGATPETAKGAVFLSDSNGIKQCLLIGIEKHLFVFYITLFCYIHIQSNSSLAAALIILICDMIITFIRSFFGERNISKKSLLDSKFLI